MADGPLRGIRILDLTHVWAGPLGTRVLSDLGAEVVKIERSHGRGPRKFVETPSSGWIGGEPGEDPWNNLAAFVKLARNCRSVSLDLKHPRGRETFLQLVAVADVVIENFSARAMPALNLGYEALRAANRRIIYVTMPGYGTYGPYRDWVAFGTTAESLSGLTGVMGYSKEEPRNTAMAINDPIAGTSATAAVVTALRRREETGQGACVEMSLHEAGVSFHGPWLIEHQLGGVVEPLGNRHPGMAPHGVYRCRGEDNWIALACPDEAAWQALCAVVGRDLDPRLDLDQRAASHDHLDDAITAWTTPRHKVDAAEQLQKAGVAAGPVNNTPGMLADEQVQHREFFATYERFSTPMPGNPIKMAGISPDDWTPCPKLGADNAAVLRDWLGYSEQEISDLADAAIIADQPPE